MTTPTATAAQSTAAQTKIERRTRSGMLVKPANLLDRDNAWLGGCRRAACRRESNVRGTAENLKGGAPF
jgi:hypothetical protein